MNNEEMDIYIKSKIKDNYIPERIDNLFNNSAKIIENKGEKQMEENLKSNQNQEQNNNNQKKPENKKIVGGLLLSAALTSFFTGITEPIEFTFLFIAPVLFFIHCIFAGISFVLMHVLEICIGTTFSCGLIDFMLYGVMQGQQKTNWLMIIPVYVVYAILYYAVFRFVIVKFNLATPGRESGEAEIKLYSKQDFNNRKEESNKEANLRSKLILEALGNLENLQEIDCCATRLRLTVKDTTHINEDLLKQTGAKGVIKKGCGVQVIYGPQVSIIKSELEEYVQEQKQ